METVEISKLAASIDHTLLKAETGEGEVVELCRQARQWGFAAVCVNPVWVATAVRELEGNAVAVAAVCGFPLGATTNEVKVFEAGQCLERGATEIDVVLDIGWAREGRWRLVEDELAAVASTVHQAGGRLKVILECGLLERSQRVEAARRAMAAGADYLKTSTGFLAGGATVEDVTLLRRVAGSAAGVKASGGIRNLDQALAMLAAGADRLGTSSGVRIMEEARDRLHG